MNNTTLNVLKNICKSYLPLEKRLASVKAKRADMIAKLDADILTIEENIDILNETAMALSGGYNIPQILNEEHLAGASEDKLPDD